MDDGRIEPADEQRLPGDELNLRVQIQAFRLDINTINDFWILSIHFASILFMDYKTVLKHSASLMIANLTLQLSLG